MSWTPDELAVQAPSMIKRSALSLGGLVVAVLALLPVVLDSEYEELTDEVRGREIGRFVQLSHGVVHYEIAGPPTGQPVVLVHGFSVPLYIWAPTFDALARAGFRVVRYDLYGRGLSERPDVPYDRRLFEQQLLELIDALQIECPVDLVGLSMGGAVAGAFTARHPNRVRRLVLIDPSADQADLGPLGVPVVGEYVNRVYFLPSLAASQADDFHEPERFPGWAGRFRDQMRYRGFGRAMLSTLRHFASSDPMDYYRQVAAQKRRVLLVWGQEDRTVPFAESARVREALGDVEFLPVPEAAHLPHYERPEVVNPRLVGFLAEP